MKLPDANSLIFQRHGYILAYALIALLIMLPLLGPGYYLTLDMQFGPGSFSDFQFSELYGTGPSQYGAYLQELAREVAG